MEAGFFHCKHMKLILTALAFVLAVGCDVQSVTQEWSEKAAIKWAIELGDTSPKATCLNHQYFSYENSQSSDCSVNAFGRIHKLYCVYPEMKCTEVLP